jgi:cytochrome c oxidase subunit 2
MSFIFISFLDIPVQGQIGFQDAATAVMHGIVNLHHHIFFFLIIVCIFVFYIFLRTYKFSVLRETFPLVYLFLLTYSWVNAKHGKTLSIFSITSKNVTEILNIDKVIALKTLVKWYKYDVAHATILEIIWTIIPSLILLCIVGPSFALLYAMDAPINPEITIKIIGHQWYWSYEYTDSVLDFYGRTIKTFVSKDSSLEFLNISKDSYMIATSDLAYGELRLLEVDNALYVPVFTKIRFDITADDVIHAFAVPSLGIKVDAIPGRINVAYLKILRTGIFFGQCSELCGVNHGFMPIKVVALDFSNFFKYTCASK